MGTYDTIGGTPISPPDDEVCEWCEEGRCTASEKDVPHCSYKTEDGKCDAWWSEDLISEAF